MKFYRSISLNSKVCPPEFYAEVVVLAPHGVRGLTFLLEAKPEDEENAELIECILSLCKRRGLKETRGDVVGAYIYSIDRKYDPEDLAAANYLLLASAPVFLYDVARDESGRLMLPASKAKASLKFASVFATSWIIIADAVRREFEAAGLIGLTFSEVALTGRSVRAESAPFWELQSSLALPKMLNSIRYDNTSFPCYGIDDWPYRRPEPHYRKSEVEALGAFDVAHTLEPLGRKVPRLVISQRFYKVCLTNGIPLEAWPVRIDPD